MALMSSVASSEGVVDNCGGAGGGDDDDAGDVVGDVGDGVRDGDGGDVGVVEGSDGVEQTGTVVLCCDDSNVEDKRSCHNQGRTEDAFFSGKKSSSLFLVCNGKFHNECFIVIKELCSKNMYVAFTL